MTVYEVNDVRVKSKVFYRSEQVLWRSNDDGTALLLNSMTGAAYLLPPAVVTIWMALEKGIYEKELSSPAIDSDPLTEVLDSLIDKGLVDCKKDGGLIERNSLLNNLTGPLHIESIAFGACDCSGVEASRYGKRAVECASVATPREQTSIVI